MSCGKDEMEKGTEGIQNLDEGERKESGLRLIEIQKSETLWYGSQSVWKSKTVFARCNMYIQRTKNKYWCY